MEKNKQGEEDAEPSRKESPSRGVKASEGERCWRRERPVQRPEGRRVLSMFKEMQEGAGTVGAHSGR